MVVLARQRVDEGVETDGWGRVLGLIRDVMAGQV